MQVCYRVMFAFFCVVSSLSWAAIPSGMSPSCVNALFGEDWIRPANGHLATNFDILEIHASFGKTRSEVETILATYASGFAVYHRYIHLDDPSGTAEFHQSRAVSDWIEDEGTIYRMRSKSDGTIYLVFVAYPGENLAGVILLEQSKENPEIIGVIEDPTIVNMTAWRTRFEQRNAQ